MDRYLSELAKIDFEQLETQEKEFAFAANQPSVCATAEETNACLHSIYKQMNLTLPWNGYADFDSFMYDKNSRLVFA